MPDPSSPANGHDHSADNTRGIVAMVVCMFCFNTNDTLIKLVSDDLPTGEIVFLRGILATAMIAVLAAARREPILAFKAGGRMMAWRTVGDAVGTIMFLTALFHMSLATATAILQAMPIVMTLVSALLLGEVVRWRRWVAVTVGFVGVLMIIQPGGENFNVYSLIALSSLALMTLRDVTTRYIPRTVPTLSISFAGSLAVMISGGLLGLTESWSMPSANAWMLLAGSACFLIGGYIFLVAAMRAGELSIVSPFRYSIILIALVYSYFVFGEVPNLLALAGIALLVASGVYVFHREGRLRKKPVLPG